MRKIIVAITLSLLASSTYAQINKKIVFDYKNCEDASVFYLPRQDLQFGPVNSTNSGKIENFGVLEWTWDSHVGSKKSLLFFDLSSMPKDIKIINAKLSLSLDQVQIDKYFSASKSNALKIQSVTSAWKENKVTWDNKPEVSNINQITLPNNHDIKNIDITLFVKEWIKNPKSNYGIMISCAESDYYRGVVFASSEHSDKNLRPKLTIIYTKNRKALKAPAYEVEHSDNCNNNQTLIVFDLDFNMLYKEKNFSTDRLSEIIDELETGHYFFQLISDEMEINAFQIIKK